MEAAPSPSRYWDVSRCRCRLLPRAAEAGPEGDDLSVEAAEGRPLLPASVTVPAAAASFASKAAALDGALPALACTMASRTAVSCG